jgi:3-deoxy-D-manno-octulosonic acid kinase
VGVTAIPPRFVRHHFGAWIAAVDAGFESAVRAAGLLDPAGIDRAWANGAVPGGRARNAVIALPGRDERVHLRPFRHGGWIGPLRGGHLGSPRRPLAELAAAAHLAAAGAPVPRPVLVVAHERAPWFWRAAVGTVHVEAAIDLGALLAARPERRSLLAVAAAAGAAVRRFHEAGGCHADLHAGNLLIVDMAARLRAFVIDLDRARVVPEVAPRRRARELMRLHRSLVKRQARDALAPEVVACFLEAYCGGEQALRVALCARLGRERRRRAVHRLGYGRR